MADPTDPDKTANLIVNFNSQPVKSNTTNYRVLETDYESYSLVFSCSNVLKDKLKIEYLWILTRQQFPDEQMIKNLYEKLARLNFNTNMLWQTRQTDCPKFD